jgi:hypothetical protein
VPPGLQSRLGRQKQEDREFEMSLGYIERFCLKIKTKDKQKEL